MTTAQKIYASLTECGNSDVAFIANCIMTGCGKRTTKLKNLQVRVQAGQDIRCGNLWGTLRINGEQMDFAVLNG